MHLANLESMNSPFTLLLERECRVYKCEWKSHVECMELEVSDISICYIKASIEVSPWCNFHNYCYHNFRCHNKWYESWRWQSSKVVPFAVETRVECVLRGWTSEHCTMQSHKILDKWSWKKTYQNKNDATQD